MGGLNSIQPLMVIPPSDALMAENFNIRPFGLEIRKGWKYWFSTAFPAEVRSIMTFIGRNIAQRKIFASTAQAGIGFRGPIYDITTPGGTAPTVPTLIPSTEPTTPGEWSNTMFNTPGGEFLCAVQHGSGYYRYGVTAASPAIPVWNEIVGTAGVPGELEVKFPAGDASGTTTKDFIFIMSWKNRLWFFAKDRSRAYYLPTNAVSGQLEMFDFGAMFRGGGSLQFMATWTYDGGAGIDDSLIIVSSEGDLLIYQGTDPASASTFSLKGMWYIGQPTYGRRNFAQQGGDLWVITEYGVISVSDLVSGRVTIPTEAASGKYNPTFARTVTETRGQAYWFLIPFPSEELLYMGSPFVSTIYGYRINWMMNAITKAWASTSDMNPLCAEVYGGQFIFGDRDGWIKLGFSGFRDGDNYDSSVQGTDVTAKLQAGFSDFGSPSQNKRATRVRLLGIAELVPSYRMRVVSEYDMQVSMSTPSPLQPAGALWDVALWDAAYWQLSQQTFKKWFGVAGFGKLLSLQLAIRGGGYTLITDYEITYQEGLGF